MSSPVSIGIIKIEEDEFVFKADNIKRVDQKKLRIEFNLGFNWEMENEHFYVTLTVLYKYDISGVEIELSRFVTTTGYEVRGLKEILNLQEEGFEIPDFFMLTFVGTAVSSARGMLAYRLSGTILADFYLPLVDPKDFLEHVKDQNKSVSSKKRNIKKASGKRGAQK